MGIPSRIKLHYTTTMGTGKPRGIKAARKLRSHRRVSKWAQKSYNKSHSQARYNKQLYNLASHAKGIVVEKVGIEAKQPNSAIRKCVRVQLIKNGKKVQPSSLMTVA